MTKKIFACIFANAILFSSPLSAESLRRKAGPFVMPVQAVFTERLGLCVVEQKGRILCNGGVFLDITQRVSSGGEKGLLSMAPAPDFDRATHTNIYLNYTAEISGLLHTVVAALPVISGRPDVQRMRTVLSFKQPYANHNGGLLLFGPDGLLYIGTGDGGSGGDPQGNGQNKRTFLGKILRINPAGSTRQPYTVPSNPLARSGYLPEIYATGLRNPWRFSFDRKTGLLYAADVGQNRLEEINVVRAGDNLGWNIMEGSECFRAQTCNRSGLTLPIHTYGRTEGQSITGGYVYRGSKIPALRAHYVFGDFVTGKVWAFPVDDSGKKTGPVRTLIESAGNISSFAEDRDGELYVIDYRTGTVLSLER